MGMFDWIKDFAIKCPKCGGKMEGFQTKDLDLELKQVPFDHPGLENFYTDCRNLVSEKEAKHKRPNWKSEWECNAWVDMFWEDGELKAQFEGEALDDFEVLS